MEPGVLTADFEPIETSCLRARTPTTPEINIRLIEAHARAEGQRSHNLRAVKLRDRTLLMIDGKQKLVIPGTWPAARVGLTAEGLKASFNGITCFRIDAM